MNMNQDSYLAKGLKCIGIVAYAKDAIQVAKEQDNVKTKENTNIPMFTSGAEERAEEISDRVNRVMRLQQEAIDIVEEQQEEEVEI